VICEWPVQCYSKVFGFGEERQGFIVEVNFHLTFSFFVVEVEDSVFHFPFDVGSLRPPAPIL